MRDERVERILADPYASDWLKRALRSAVERDAVDAANDAAYLAELLGDRADEILAERTGYGISRAYVGEPR